MAAVDTVDKDTLVALAMPFAFDLWAGALRVLTRLNQLATLLDDFSEFFFIHILPT